MLTVTANESRLSPAHSVRRTAPGLEGTTEPQDQVNLHQRPLSEQPTNGGSGSVWAAAGLAAIAITGFANGAAAQVGPSTSLIIEQPSLTVDVSQPLAKGQLEEMRWAGEAKPFDNARARDIKEEYRELVELVGRQAQDFTELTARIREAGEGLEGKPFRLFSDGSYVFSHSDNGLTVTEFGENFAHYKLTERAESITLEHEGGRATLYLTDGWFHEAGDFVIQHQGQTISTSQKHATSIQRQRGQGETMVFETFERPEIGIAIYPGPTFQYEARGAEDMSVTVLQDGSTEVRQNGELTREPGLESQH